MYQPLSFKSFRTVNIKSFISLKVMSPSSIRWILTEKSTPIGLGVSFFFFLRKGNNLFSIIKPPLQIQGRQSVNCSCHNTTDNSDQGILHQERRISTHQEILHIFQPCTSFLL